MSSNEKSRTLTLLYLKEDIKYLWVRKGELGSTNSIRSPNTKQPPCFIVELSITKSNLETLLIKGRNKKKIMTETVSVFRVFMMIKNDMNNGSKCLDLPVISYGNEQLFWKTSPVISRTQFKYFAPVQR